MQEEKLLQVHREIKSGLQALLLPLFAFTLGTFLLVFLTVWYIAGEHDNLQNSESRHLLMTLMEQKNEESLLRVRDYAHWDAAYKNLVLNFDDGWAADNIGQYIHKTFPETRTYVFGPDNTLKYAAEEGVRLTPEKATTYPKLVDAVQELREQFASGDPEPLSISYVADENGNVWAAAITVIKPDYSEFEKGAFQTSSNDLYFLVFLRQVDGAPLEDIGDDFGFSNLTFRLGDWNKNDQSAAIFLNDIDGLALGTITWSPRQFGQHLISQTLINTGVLLLLLVGIMIFVWRKGFRLLNTVNTAFHDMTESSRIAKMYERGITELVEGEFLYELSVYEALQKIAVNAGQTLGVERTTIWRYDETTDQMYNMFLEDSLYPDSEQKMVQFHLSEYPELEDIIASGEPGEIYRKFSQSNPIALDETWWAENVPATVLAVPIARHKLKEGIIFFSSYDIEYDWSDEKLRFAAAISDIVSLIIEVHARNIIESELRTAKNRAEMANAAKSDFLANMSHELRTPLNAIIGFSDIMAQKIFGELGVPQYEEYNQDINQSARHLLMLINDILEISKHESAKFQLHPEIVNIEDEINQAVRLASGRFMNKKTVITVDVEEEVETIEVDVKCFRQIALNIISNALKFCEGGCVLEISATADEDYVQIVIKDNGIGIPEEMQQKVFEAFSQVENSLNKRYEGTGLGLSITKSLVELHHGSIELTSKPNEGTTIIVKLPRRQTNSPTMQLAAS